MPVSDMEQDDLNALRRSLVENQRALDQLKQTLTASDQRLERFVARFEAQERELADLRNAPAPSKAGAKSKDEVAYRIALTLSLANAAYDSLFVLDNDLKIIAINDSAEALFSRKRPIGESLEEVAHNPELAALVQDALSNAEESLEEQFTFNKRSYKVRVQVIRREPHVFIGVAMQDVSDLVRLNRARRDMVGNISHELRTPIANIRMVIDSLFHEQDKPKRKQSTSALKTIARETDSLLWLVQELLDLSMIESGQAILRMVGVPLRPLVDEVVERMSEHSEVKEVRIVADVPEGIQVLADDDQLRRVLVNLVHNALKWSPKGGVVTIRAENQGDEVMTSIDDEGEGVPDDQTERIFERFYQVDASRSKGEGTGLGLAICKHIVETHGGRIWAEGSHDGQEPGGHFRFTLARAEEPDANGNYSQDRH